MFNEQVIYALQLNDAFKAEFESPEFEHRVALQGLRRLLKLGRGSADG